VRDRGVHAPTLANERVPFARSMYSGAEREPKTAFVPERLTLISMRRSGSAYGSGRRSTP